jgi:V8-like Glu-specific endopeptidase
MSTISEKKIKNFPDPVSISGTKTILNQMINCICKIKLKGVNGTGFFCAIHLENINQIYCLITNNHVLNEDYYRNNTKINLLLNDEEKVVVLNLEKKRKTFFHEKYDIALIEVKKDDGINNFLELDENIFKEKESAIYEDKSIYLLQYPGGKTAAVSYGLINAFYNFNIIHTCSTEKGSSGAPILNLQNNKVIGVHKEASISFNFNIATFLKFPLNDFYSKIKNKNKISNSDFDVNTKNKQNLLKKNTFSNENDHKKNNIYNKGIKGFDNNSMNLMGINNNPVEQKTYRNSIYNNPLNPQNKFKISFKVESSPFATPLKLEPETTIDKMLRVYLKKVNKEELYNHNDKIVFITGEYKLKFGDKTPIENIFANTNSINQTKVVLVSFT